MKKIDWERKIIDQLITVLGISNGDAQGIVEVHTFEIAQAWAKGSSPSETTQQLIDKSQTPTPNILSDDQFFEQFTPVKNPFDSNTS